MNKVSILVNCYNSEAFLKEALDSIYQGTYKFFEIILVDNCSTDATSTIAKEYDSRLKYVRTDKLIPLYSARNFGLKYVTGDYLAFLDSDDVWMPEKLEQQISLMQKNKLNFIYSNYNNIVEQKSVVKKILTTMYLNLLKLNLYFRSSGFRNPEKLIEAYDINLQTVVIRVNKIKEPFNEKLNLYGDFEFFIKMILSQQIQPYYFSRITSLSRIHSSQLSRKNNTNWIKEAKICYRSLKPLMNNKLQKDFIKSHYMLHLSSLYMEQKKVLKGLKIKLALSCNSTSHFIHFCKSTLGSLRK